MASTQKMVLMAIVLNLILGMAYSVSMNDLTDVNGLENYAYSYTNSEMVENEKNEYLTTSQTQSNEIEANALDQVKSGRSVFSTFFKGIAVGTSGMLFWKGNNFMYSQLEILILGMLTMLVWLFDALLLMEAYLYFVNKKTNG